MALASAEEEILETLGQIRKDAGQPRIGTREVELAGYWDNAQVFWQAVKNLSEQGLVERRSGWFWITDKGFNRLED